MLHNEITLLILTEPSDIGLNSVFPKHSAVHNTNRIGIDKKFMGCTMKTVIQNAMRICSVPASRNDEIGVPQAKQSHNGISQQGDHVGILPIVLVLCSW